MLEETRRPWTSLCCSTWTSCTDTGMSIHHKQFVFLLYQPNSWGTRSRKVKHVNNNRHVWGVISNLEVISLWRRQQATSARSSDCNSWAFWNETNRTTRQRQKEMFPVLVSIKSLFLTIKASAVSVIWGTLMTMTLAPTMTHWEVDTPPRLLYLTRPFWSVVNDLMIYF